MSVRLAQEGYIILNNIHANMQGERGSGGVGGKGMKCTLQRHSLSPALPLSRSPALLLSRSPALPLPRSLDQPRSRPTTDRRHQYPCENIYDIMISPIDSRDANTENKGSQPITDRACKLIGREEHGRRARHVCAWECPAMHSPVLFNQIDECRELPSSQFDLL